MCFFPSRNDLKRYVLFQIKFRFFSECFSFSSLAVSEHFQFDEKESLKMLAILHGLWDSLVWINGFGICHQVESDKIDNPRLMKKMARKISQPLQNSTNKMASFLVLGFGWGMYVLAFSICICLCCTGTALIQRKLRFYFVIL